MHIKVDKEKPDGTFEKYVMDTVYDGEEGSDVFQVPPHWHKVGLSVCPVSRSRFRKTLVLNR